MLIDPVPFLERRWKARKVLALTQKKAERNFSKRNFDRKRGTSFKNGAGKVKNFYDKNSFLYIFDVTFQVAPGPVTMS